MYTCESSIGLEQIRFCHFPRTFAPLRETFFYYNFRQFFPPRRKDLLAEALKSRRCPGIVSADGVSGRKARVAGTGLEVWEIIATYKSINRDFTRLKNAYHWLTEQQLRAATGYYLAYTTEIDQLIEKNESWTREKITERYPYLHDGGA